MEKEQAVEECKQQVPDDWKSETEDRADCIGSDCLQNLWHAGPGAVTPCQERRARLLLQLFYHSTDLEKMFKELEMRSAALGVQWCMIQQSGPGDEERDTGCMKD